MNPAAVFQLSSYCVAHLYFKKYLNSLYSKLITGTINLLNKIQNVQVCDAREDDKRTLARLKKIFTKYITSNDSKRISEKIN